jgi:hypothetical protein
MPARAVRVRGDRRCAQVIFGFTGRGDRHTGEEAGRQELAILAVTARFLLAIAGGVVEAGATNVRNRADGSLGSGRGIRGAATPAARDPGNPTPTRRDDPIHVVGAHR